MQIKINLERAVSKADEDKNSLGLITKEAYAQHAHDCLQPGYSYYTGIYNTPGGELCVHASRLCGHC